MNARDAPLSRPSRPTMIGGYRVIRALGTGTRSTVWVGHSDQRADAPTVALKVFGDVGDDSIADELAACESVDSQHVVRLVDVCTAAGPGHGPAVCMVLEWLGEGSLATLVRQRRRIRPSEAVTVLVSVLRGIRDLHAAGLAHNAVLPTNVLFDRCGRPVLVSLGHATRLPPPHSDSGIAARGAEWEQLLAIFDTVITRVEADGRDEDVAGIRRALEELALGRDEQGSCDQVEDALYAFAQPAPLVLHPTSIPGAVHRADSDEPERQTLPEPVSRRTVAEGIAARTEAILEAGPVRTLKDALAPALRRRRKQLVFGAVLASVVGVVGLAAIPPGDAAPAPRKSTSVHTQRTSEQHTETPRPTVEASRPAGDASDASSGSEDGAADPIAADEPVAAVVALLAARAHCFTKQSAACLKLVDQDASPLMEADATALKHADALPDLSTANASLVERTGDSALVELVQPNQATQSQNETARPVSVLAIKGDSGWRLREIFSA